MTEPTDDVVWTQKIENPDELQNEGEPCKMSEPEVRDSDRELAKLIDDTYHECPDVEFNPEMHYDSEWVAEYIAEHLQPERDKHAGILADVWEFADQLEKMDHLPHCAVNDSNLFSFRCSCGKTNILVAWYKARKGDNS